MGISSRTVTDAPPAAVAPRPTRDELYGALADRRRLAVLAALSVRGSPVSESALAGLVVARERGKSPCGVTESERAAARSSLRHVHLPRLQSVRLVERDGDRVAPGGSPLWRDPRFLDLLDGVDVGPAATANAFDALADAESRAIVEALRADRGRAFDEAELAVVVADETGADEHAARIAVRHRHLPALADAGIAEVDAEAGRARYLGDPFLDGWWFAGEDD